MKKATRKIEAFILNVNGEVTRYASKAQRDMLAELARAEGKTVTCNRMVGLWTLPEHRLDELYALAERKGFAVV